MEASHKIIKTIKKQRFIINKANLSQFCYSRLIIFGDIILSQLLIDSNVCNFGNQGIKVQRILVHILALIKGGFISLAAVLKVINILRGRLLFSGFVHA